MKKIKEDEELIQNSNKVNNYNSIKTTQEESENETVKFLNTHHNQNDNVHQRANNNSRDISNISLGNYSVFINHQTTNFDLYKGLFFMFISCIFKSLFSILSKFCLEKKADLTSFQLLAFRTYFMVLINILIMLFYPVKVFSNEFIGRSKLIPMIIRSVLAIFSMTLLIYSLKFLHLSDVYSIYYMYPGLVMLFSYCFLKERMNFLDYTCLIACFIGAILIIKPDFIFPTPVKSHNHRLSMLGLVLISALLKAIEDIIIRDSGKDFHYLSIPFLYSCIGIVLFPLLMIIFDGGVPSFTFVEVIVVFLVALCTYLYQAFMALGLQNENAGRVSMVNYFQVAFMYISDITIFRREFTFIDFLGPLLIFGFNFINGLYKCNKRMENKAKIQMKKNLEEIQEV